MGTKADFYVGKNKNAEWIGSIAYDGYEFAEDKNHPIRQAKTESEYRAAVAQELSKRDDATTVEQGWPWPWEDSGTTDYAYAFTNNRLSWKGWKSYPDMSSKKNITLGRRSGLLIIGPTRPIDLD